MSEIKRIPLQSAELSHASKKPEKTKPKPHCYRFELNLPESTETKCPEFNFSDLLKSKEKRLKKGKKKDENSINNGASGLDDDDDGKVKDVANYFENKYGKTKYKNGDIDLGAGYDENDSFIDNTDAYDEIVPEEVTTAHGGFYINSGPLEFKNTDNAKPSSQKDDEDSDDEDDDEDDSSDDESTEDSEEDDSKKPSKRSLSSSEDEEKEENNRPPPKVKARVENQAMIIDD